MILSLFLSTVTFSQNTESMKNITSEYTYNTRYTTIDSLEIAYTKEGEGPTTLFFIHGLSSNADAWSRNIASLKANYTCVAIDLPGFGKSSKIAAAYTPTYFAKISAKCIEKLQLKNVVVVGHSMGGQAAIKVALNFPKKIQKLILVAPAGIEEFDSNQALMIKSVLTAELVSKTTDEQIDRNYQLNFFKLPIEAQKMISDRKKIKQATDFQNYCSAIAKSVEGMLDDPIHAQLKLVTIPTLIIFGQNDNLIPNKYFNPKLTTLLVGTKATEEIKNSSLQLIAESGHFVQFEKPSEVNEIISNWLIKNR
jgi:pimeloyl-ACP methyl ester carboxylesterase